MGSTGSTTLDCTRDANEDIEIYGLSEDVFSKGNYQVKIRVTGYTTPNTQISSSDWGVTVYRFGTGTVLADYDGTSSISLTPGTITDIAITPYLSDYCSSDLPVIGI